MKAADARETATQTDDWQPLRAHDRAHGLAVDIDAPVTVAATDYAQKRCAAPSSASAPSRWSSSATATPVQTFGSISRARASACSRPAERRVLLTRAENAASGEPRGSAGYAADMT